MPRPSKSESRQRDAGTEPSGDASWLSGPSLLILISLAGGQRHGYGIMQDIAAFSNTQVGPGTLYGALARLEASGMVTGVESSDRTRPYRLTAQGRHVLDQRLRALTDLLATAVARSAA